jgi:hypothetical protein
MGGAELSRTRAHARVIFCTAEGRMILPHEFVKQTPNLPPNDLDTVQRIELV